MHRIAEKLRAEYTTQIGHRPAPSEVASWQNSLMALSMLVDQAELSDHGVILEYQLGNTSRRLDAMLTGHSPTSAENAVVVELKQLSDGCALTGPTVGHGLEAVAFDGRTRITTDRSIHAGGPGLRLSVDEVLADFLELTAEDIQVSIAYAARQLRDRTATA
jgi:uncharacterized protein (DUF433 family)